MTMTMTMKGNKGEGKGACTCYDCFGCFNNIIGSIGRFELGVIYELKDDVVKELICTEGRIKTTLETIVNEYMVKEEFGLDDERCELEDLLDYLFEIGVLRKKHIGQALDDIASIKVFDKYKMVKNITRYFTNKNKYIR